MRCEVIAVGTELLLGQVVDTNSAWIGEQLALAGIDAHFQTRVGDNLGRMISALRIALDRADAVILCGGLGPTQDDITREAIAEVTGAALVRDETLVERIQERFAARGRAMPQNNLRQADVPAGASIIAQIPGTAPGLVCPLADKVIYAVPGVPYEMQEMVAGTIIPDLQKRAGSAMVIQSRILRTWGESESALAELIAGRITELDRTTNPTIAFLASGIEGIKVRITAKARDHATARRLLDQEDSSLRAILGDRVFGTDGQTMEWSVIDLLRYRGMTLAVAETVTGGLMSARLSAVDGASDVLRGGIVIGPNDPQLGLLDVPAGAVAPEAAAKTMARGVCRLFDTDVGLAAAAAADFRAQEEYPAGTVFLGLAIRGAAETRSVRLPGDAERVRQFTVISLLDFLRLRILRPT